MKVYDSSVFCFCDLCGEVVIGNTPQIVESDGLVTHIGDLLISHTQCWEQTFGENKLHGSADIE